MFQAPNSQPKLVAAVAASNLGLATLHWHYSNQVHFRATAAIRYFRRARHQHAVELDMIAPPENCINLRVLLQAL
jgi:hypothetical protein